MTASGELQRERVATGSYVDRDERHVLTRPGSYVDEDGHHHAEETGCYTDADGHHTCPPRTGRYVRSEPRVDVPAD